MDRISYEDSCFIVNAMQYYIASFKVNTKMSKESLKYYQSIIERYEKLEKQILDLRIT